MAEPSTENAARVPLRNLLAALTAAGAQTWLTVDANGKLLVASSEAARNILNIDQHVAAVASSLLSASVTFSASLARLTLIVNPNGDSDAIGINMGGAAVAGSQLLQPGVYTWDCNKAVADTITVIRDDDEDVKITVIQEG